MLVRFAYLAVSRAFAVLWLLRMTDREKDVEILALRHQIAVLQRQFGGQRPRLRPEDRALLAALLMPLARGLIHSGITTHVRVVHQRTTRTFCDRQSTLLEARQRQTLVPFSARHNRQPPRTSVPSWRCSPAQRNNDERWLLSCKRFHKGLKAWIDGLVISRWVPHQAWNSLATSQLRAWPP